MLTNSKVLKALFLSVLILVALSLIFIKIKHFKARLSHLESQLKAKLLHLESQLDRANINKILGVFNYKTLPIEKLDKLDFISPEILSAGKREMVRHKVIFTGISRDNANQLPYVMRHIEYIGEFFADYRVIIFENDSTDGTKFVLNIWKAFNSKVDILSQDFFNKKRPSIKFMAEMRNKYLDVLHSPQYKEFDIVIVMDMDMVYGIDIRGVQDSFSKINSWDMICSNGIETAKGNMYDAFAFRNDEFPDNPNSYLAKYNKSYWDDENINAIKKVYSPNSPLIPVDSCFGGFAIYKKELFNDCLYDSTYEFEDCEHVYLHKCMKGKHNAKMFMNPAQIIRYEHYK